MSKGEWKADEIKIICITVMFVCVAIFAIFFMKGGRTDKTGEEFILPENVKIKCEDGERVTIEASVSKEKLFEKLSEKGIEIPQLLLLLPERVDLLCDAIINVSGESEKTSFSIISLKLNEFEIPSGLLSEIGEFDLDFKRSLVYN